MHNKLHNEWHDFCKNTINSMRDLVICTIRKQIISTKIDDVHKIEQFKKQHMNYLNFTIIWWVTCLHFTYITMDVLDSAMFLCRQNQVHTSFWYHYVVIIWSGSPRLCDFSPREAGFTPREVKILQNQGRSLLCNILIGFNLSIYICKVGK